MTLKQLLKVVKDRGFIDLSACPEDCTAEAIECLEKAIRTERRLRNKIDRMTPERTPVIFDDIMTDEREKDKVPLLFKMPPKTEPRT